MVLPASPEKYKGANPNSATLSPDEKTLYAAWWAGATKDVDFTAEDKMDFATYSALLWRGLMGDRPYPTTHSGADLRLYRTEYLAEYYASLK